MRRAPGVPAGFWETRMLKNRLLFYEDQGTRVVWQANTLSYVFLATVGCLALLGAFNFLAAHP
jgi:hypothetical protein